MKNGDESETTAGLEPAKPTMTSRGGFPLNLRSPLLPEMSIQQKSGRLLALSKSAVTIPTGDKPYIYGRRAVDCGRLAFFL